MARCCICDRQCVPMADYDLPTCMNCDDAMDAVATRAALVDIQTAPVVVDLFGEIRQQVPWQATA